MDLYTFILFLISISGSLIITAAGIFSLVYSKQTQKLIQESQKLQLKLNQLKSDFKATGSEPQDFVLGAIGSGGLDGIIDALGLPGFLKPLAKGLIDKVKSDPELQQKIFGQLGLKVPNEGSTEKEIGLL